MYYIIPDRVIFKHADLLETWINLLSLLIIIFELI